MPRTRRLLTSCALAAAGILAVGAPLAGRPAPQQPEFATLKADFVPGEKTLFYDDFTDMTAGEAPPHFKVRGATPDLQGAGATRQLLISQGGTLVPNLTVLPKNFTYELEAKADPGRGTVQTFHSFFSKDKEALLLAVHVNGGYTDVVLSVKVPKFEELGRRRITGVDTKAPIRVALWLQNGRARVFVNGDKQLDANQVELPAIDRIEMRTGFAGTNMSIALRTMRIAESTPDFSSTILATGRYVSHGILFDSDSDHIKPESAAILQAVARGLDANASLAVRIEGHTDASGDAAHNLDLSKRRAEAVKAVLVSQFHIDGARLTTAGLGATRPVGPNDTPQGRANNRRVEFVKP